MNAFEKIKSVFAWIFGVIGAFFRGIATAWRFLKYHACNNAVVDFCRDYYERNKIYVYTGLFVFTLIFIFFFPQFVVTISPGEAGVEWSRFMGGTIVDRVYAEGTHLRNPFNRLIIYNIRTQETKHEMVALTKDGLYVGISLSVRYRPQYDFLPILHQKIGPDYAQIIVIPEVEAELRRVIGRFTPEELFTTQGGVLENLVKSVFAQVSENFITLDDVLIRKITLPDQIKNAIESKLVQEQQMKEYEFRLLKETKEANRRVIEAKGIEEYNRTINASLTPNLLTYEGIRATKEIATSTNSKVIIVGGGKEGLPVVLNPDPPGR